MRRHIIIIVVIILISTGSAEAASYKWLPKAEADKIESSEGTIETYVELGSDDSIRSTSIGDYKSLLSETFELRITPVVHMPSDKLYFDDWSPNNYTKRSAITLRNLYLQSDQFGAGIMQLSKSDTLLGLILDPSDQYAWDATDSILINPLGIPTAYYRYRFAWETTLTGRLSYSPWSKISKQELPYGTTESAPHGGTATNLELIYETKILESQEVSICASRTNSPWPIDANNEAGKHQSVPGRFEADVYNKYNFGTDWEFKSYPWSGGLKAVVNYAEENVDSKLMAVPHFERSFSILGVQPQFGVSCFYSHSFNHGTASMQNRFDPRRWINNSGVLSLEVPSTLFTIRSEFLYDPSSGNVILESGISIPVWKSLDINFNSIFIDGFEDLRNTNPLSGTIGLSYCF